jgi:hypothetical protein
VSSREKEVPSREKSPIIWSNAQRDVWDRCEVFSLAVLVFELRTSHLLHRHFNA